MPQDTIKLDSTGVLCNKMSCMLLEARIGFLNFFENASSFDATKVVDIPLNVAGKVLPRNLES